LLEERYVIVGSKETVIERLTELTDDLGAGIVLGAGGHMGSMPHWMVMKNTQLMAEEVIPHFREPDGKPAWAKEERLGVFTRTEHAAQVGQPELAPLAKLNGDYTDTRTAYIPERGADGAQPDDAGEPPDGVHAPSAEGAP
jgi:hypothetical protein